jgi:predicted PurR-regulated permease PerM
MTLKNKQIIQFILGLLGVIFLFWLFWQVKQVVGYFAIAVVLALMGRPLMSLLERIKVKDRSLPAWLNSLLVLSTFIFVIIFIIRFLTPVLSSQIHIIASINISELFSTFDGPLSSMEQTMRDLNIEGFNRSTIEEQLTSFVNFSAIGDFFTSMISGLGSLLIGLMSILFISFFLLKDQKIVNNIINSVTPDQYLKSVHKIISDTRVLLSRYFLGVVLQISIIATIIGIGLSIVGIPNAILIGILAGVFNIIPYLGPIIGTAFGLTLSLLSRVNENLDSSMAPLIASVLLVFAIAQVLDNFLLQPIIFSKSVKAHPLEIFVVIMIAGMVVGVVGMILAVPTYTFLRIVAKEFFQGYKVVQGLTKGL